MEMKENVSLKPFTVFQVGGPARFFTETHSKEEVIEALRWAKEKKIPSFILGLGSNILVSDQGFPGLVIKISGGKVSRDGDLITAEAGAKMAEVVNFSLQNGLVGFEWAIGVPGTIGGSVRGNAGCFGSEMKDVVMSVGAFNTGSRENVELDNSDCQFGYRHSIFKKRPELIVLGAVLKLKPGDVGEARRKIARASKARVSLVAEPADREFFNPGGHIAPQEIGRPTVGCAFKNVLWSRKDVDKEYLISRFPKFKVFEANPGLPTGFLIEEAGLKGVEIGGAMVSEKHANFIINTGNATAEDIVMLIGLIKERVHRKLDVFLEEEIQYVGF
ncbi:MAG TPA: UDP-N-acetylmuramate dehydrogenase [Candidatus Paceibacterota bacterium]